MRFIIILFCLITCTACASDEEVSKVINPKDFFAKGLELYQSDKRNIDVDTMLKMLEDENTVIIDVRSKREYDCGHIQGAININSSDITEKNLLKHIPSKDKTLITYCSNSLHSLPLRMMALSNLTLPLIYQLGYKNVYELQPGFMSGDEQLKKLPIIKNNDKEGNCCCVGEIKSENE